MKCAVHPDADAAGFCRKCGKPMCPACVRPVRDVLYCEDCLATILGHDSSVPAAASLSGTASNLPGAIPAGSVPIAPGNSGPSPVLAFFLAFLPGLGAFYNEQYGKGMIHLAIFLVLFIIALNGSLNGGAYVAVWICLGVLYFYLPIDAARTAQGRRTGQPISDPLNDFASSKPVGPIVLIGAGILFLLNNFDWFPWWRISEFFFPAVLIGVGILMFRNRMDRRP
jgi:hypothetical protein